jgi:hypothetical protein
MTMWRLSGTFLDKVGLFLIVVANLLSIVGGNMNILFAAETLDLVHILTLPSPVGILLERRIRVGILLERSLCEKTLVVAK